LKQEVYVRCHMQQLLPMKEHAPIHSAVLDSLDPVYYEWSGLIQWKVKFCLENFDVISVTGSLSYLIQFFSNPRPLPVDYLRHICSAGKQLSNYPVNFSWGISWWIKALRSLGHSNEGLKMSEMLGDCRRFLLLTNSGAGTIYFRCSRGLQRYLKI
jgi:hypothetical protein